MILSLPEALGPVADAFLDQYYFATAVDEQTISQLRKVLSFGILLLMVLLAFRGLGVHTALRFAVRIACYFLYLLSAKGIQGTRGLFLSVFTASCVIASQNIFLSPVTDTLISLLGLSQSSPWLTLLFSTVIRLLVILPLHHYLPLDHIGEPTLSSWFPLGMTVLCIMITRQLRWTDPRFYEANNLIFILLQIFMLLFLIAFEREVYRSKLEQESRLQNAINEERLKVYESQYKADASIRSLHHDMKNHLLAIRSMAEEGRDGRLWDYLDGLLEQTEEACPSIETGNRTLDGLLGQKMTLLREVEARFDIIIDFRELNFVSDMDLCTIFGNAIDNAVEACRKVAPADRRYLSIHSERTAGQLIICITNSYSGSIQMRNGLPVTSKSDSCLHGIGLSNIRKAVRKYGGVAEIDLSVTDQFSLTILLPIPDSMQ